MNTYKAGRSSLLDKVTYGNNGQVEYTYDDYDRLSGVKYDGESGQRYTYQYGANGRVAFVHDNHLNRTLQSEYDLAERPVQLTQRDSSGNLLYRTTVGYDSQNRLSSFRAQTATDTHSTTYDYNRDSQPTKVSFDGTIRKVEYTNGCQRTNCYYPDDQLVLKNRERVSFK